ncbi:MAG: hypothetical protein DWQ01_13700 [Planctomycetota bacterium]|nr:MAG: hypothetical protein DWQ01_13700 [Planctomycetota bacterium]
MNEPQTWLQESLPWAVQFLLHSGFWLGGAWTIQKLFAKGNAGFRDRLWKAAVLGSLLSPFLTQSWSLSSWNLFSFGWTSPVAVEGPPPTLEAESGGPLWSALPPAAGEGAARSALSLPPNSFSELDSDNQPAGLGTVAAPAPLPAASPWSTRLFWSLWILVLVWSLWQLARIFGSHARLGRQLRQAKAVTDPQVLQLWRSLQASDKTIPLFASSTVQVPMAAGLIRRRVVLPDRALQSLPASALAALLAHEIAHHRRADPWWTLLFRLCRHAMPWQPLYRLAQREAESAAEELCDRWAARRTGNPRALAHCLTEVAAWLLRPQPLPAPAMASRPSLLRTRVQRLLSPPGPHHANEDQGNLPWTWWSGVLLVALFLPGFRYTAQAATPEAFPLQAENPSLAEATVEMHAPLQPADLFEATSVLRLTLEQIESELQSLEPLLHRQRPEWHSELANLQNRFQRLKASQEKLQTLLQSWSEGSDPEAPGGIDVPHAFQ